MNPSHQNINISGFSVRVATPIQLLSQWSSCSMDTCFLTHHVQNSVKSCAQEDQCTQAGRKSHAPAATRRIVGTLTIVPSPLLSHCWNSNSTSSGLSGTPTISAPRANSSMSRWRSLSLSISSKRSQRLLKKTWRQKRRLVKLEDDSDALVRRTVVTDSPGTEATS